MLIKTKKTLVFKRFFVELVMGLEPAACALRMSNFFFYVVLSHSTKPHNKAICLAFYLISFDNIKPHFITIKDKYGTSTS